MNYKRAFKCSKCPQNNTEEGCPMWWEFMQTNIQSGEERLEKMCGYQAMPIFLTEVIKASNRPAAEIGSMRNSLLDAIATVPLLIHNTIEDAKVIEHRETD